MKEILGLAEGRVVLRHSGFLQTDRDFVYPDVRKKNLVSVEICTII